MRILIWTLLLLLRCKGITARGEPPRVIEDGEKKFREELGKKNFRLSCPVVSSQSENLIMSWMKNGEMIDEFDSRYKLANHKKELRIKNLRLEDSGRYQCQATNGFGHKTVHFVLHVYDPDDHGVTVKNAIVLSENISPPSWMNEFDMDMSSPVQVNHGGRLEITCAARGNPMPELRWYRDNILLQNNQAPHIASLVVDPAEAHDGGQYRCVLENRLGSIEKLFNVTVADFFSQEKNRGDTHNLHGKSLEPIIEQPYNTTVQLGRTAQFQCRARASQPPLIKWLKEVRDAAVLKKKDPNATIVHANGMHLLVLETTEQTQVESVSIGHPENIYTNKLVIPYVTKDHGGKYICVVTSASGMMVHRAAQLIVEQKYDAATWGVRFDNIWVIGAAVVGIFLLIVIAAVLFLRANQERSKTGNKPPPPPRIPPPLAPSEPAHFHKDLRLGDTRSPIMLQDSMFHKYNASATLDRKMIRSQQRPAYDEVSHVYDSGSPQPYWPRHATYSQHSGNYRTLEVGYPHSTKHYPSMYSQEYVEQQPFINYRR